VKQLITILLLTIAFNTVGQDTAFRFVRTIPLVAADLAVDNLDNFYLITGTGQIKKYDNNGDSAAVYNEVRKFGQLQTIDVTNPLNILLFYKDFSTVVLLDRFLSQRSTVDLRRHQILEASAAALSNDNNIWVFDATQSKLKKLDEKGNLLQETNDFRSLFPEKVEPVRIYDRDGKVYLYDPNQGLYIFDYYGSFHRKLPLKDLKQLSFSAGVIRGLNNKGILVYNLSNFMEHQYEFPSSFGSFNNYIIGNTRIYGISKDAISIYSFHF
jgi:hypothetical protein